MTLKEARVYLENSGAKFTHVGIICTDIEATISSLEVFPNVGEFTRKSTKFGPEFLTVGAPYMIKQAFAKMEGHDFDLELLQPVAEESDPENIYSVMLSKYGDGLSHIAYLLPSKEVFDKTLAAFEGGGFHPILKGGITPGVLPNAPKGNAFVYLAPDNGSNCFLELLVRSVI